VGLSQLALDWGCDDLDGTVVWYDITKREGKAGTTHQELHVSDIQRLIREAGKVPVERDTLYRPIRRDVPAVSPDPPAGGRLTRPIFAGAPNFRLTPDLSGASLVHRNL
jgi:hypothetical protein